MLVQRAADEMPTDRIEIVGLRLRCVIGVGDEERRDRSDVVLDLAINVDTRQAASSDVIDDAWNYRTVTKAIIAHVEHSGYRTVEAMAEAVARICVVEHSAARAQVRVRKPGALRFARTVGVTITRQADDFADSNLGGERR